MALVYMKIWNGAGTVGFIMDDLAGQGKNLKLRPSIQEVWRGAKDPSRVASQLINTMGVIMYDVIYLIRDGIGLHCLWHIFCLSSDWHCLSLY